MNLCLFCAVGMLKPMWGLASCVGLQVHQQKMASGQAQSRFSEYLVSLLGKFCLITLSMFVSFHSSHRCVAIMAFFVSNSIPIIVLVSLNHPFSSSGVTKFAFHPGSWSFFFHSRKIIVGPSISARSGSEMLRSIFQYGYTCIDTY